MASGFLIVWDRIPPWWIWVYWTGYQHYGLEGFYLNQLKSQKFYCHGNRDAVSVPVPSETDPNRRQWYCQFRSGGDVLDLYSQHESLILLDIIVMVIFIFGLFGLSILAISKIRHIKR